MKVEPKPAPAAPKRELLPEDRAEKARACFEIHRAMLADLGQPLRPELPILDFGCGGGAFTYVYRREGLSAFGADPGSYFEEYARRIAAEGLAGPEEQVFRLIDPAAWQLPFPDDFFQFIFSQQVLEHVRDYERIFADMRRVLRPDGACLHVFPSRWRLIEGHVLVPLASFIQTEPYLRFWARLGVRNCYQHGLGSAEVARRNAGYLRECTNYPPLAVIREAARRHFAEVAFVEDVFLRHRVPAAARLSRLPGMAGLIRTLHTVVLLLKKPRR
jgi:SAM-dependent methyltransferase